MALRQQDESYTAFQNQNKEKDNTLDSKGDSGSGDLEAGNTKRRSIIINKTTGNRIAPVLPHLRGYDFGDDSSIAGSDILGKQIELEADNAIQYRTCSWQKVRYVLFTLCSTAHFGMTELSIPVGRVANLTWNIPASTCSSSFLHDPPRLFFKSTEVESLTNSQVDSCIALLGVYLSSYHVLPLVVPHSRSRSWSHSDRFRRGGGPVHFSCALEILFNPSW